MLGADLLGIKSLVELCAARFSLYMRNEVYGDPEGVRKLLGIIIE
jgi:hypothetical protein